MPMPPPLLYAYTGVYAHTYTGVYAHTYNRGDTHVYTHIYTQVGWDPSAGAYGADSCATSTWYLYISCLYSYDLYSYGLYSYGLCWGRQLCHIDSAHVYTHAY